MNALKTMITLTAFFIILWLPNHMYYLIWNLYPDITIVGVGWYLTLFMGLVNISANPFIYAAKSIIVKKYLFDRCAGRQPDNGTAQNGVQVHNQQHPTEHASRRHVSQQNDINIASVSAGRY